MEGPISNRMPADPDLNSSILFPPDLRKPLLARVSKRYQTNHQFPPSGLPPARAQSWSPSPIRRAA